MQLSAMGRIHATLTAFTLVAFAANSLLCRMALGPGNIDPVSFTSLRLGSGALALIVIHKMMGGGERSEQPGSWISALALFAYALAFSLAYVSLDTGTGALILFGMVQLTMIAAALRAGERPTARQWIGVLAGVGGLTYLVLPGLSAPDPAGAALMAVAGAAWAIYTLRGKGARGPIALTAGNFARSVPLAALATAIGWSSRHLQTEGVALAVTSGVVTSGLGYALWYRVLPRLTTTQASVLQLLVPVIAAFAGIAILDEALSPRLIIASILILGGVALAALQARPTHE